MFLLLLFSDGLGLKWVNMLMLCHIDEHFTTCLNVLGLNYEALSWLYDSATFRVNERLAIWGTLGCLRCRQLLKHLLRLWRTIS